MIVAITGSRGFVGQKLVLAHLARGDEVRVLARSPKDTIPESCKVFIGDIAAPDLLSFAFAEGVDVLYHCAAELRDESRMEEVNVMGTRSLLKLAAGRIRRWVQLSSVGVYGPRRAGEIREDAALNPANTYERTKAEADRLVSDAAKDGGFESVILRPSIIFGPGMPNRSLFQMATTIRRRLFFFIGPPGASSANYVPVDNVVDALLLCGTHPAATGRTYNLSDSAAMEEFVGMIADIVGVDPPRLRLPLAPMRALAGIAGLFPGSPLTLARVAALSNRNRYPTRRIEADLGFRHRVGLSEALRSTLLAEGFGG